MEFFTGKYRLIMAVFAFFLRCKARSGPFTLFSVAKENFFYGFGSQKPNDQNKMITQRPDFQGNCTNIIFLYNILTSGFGLKRGLIYNDFILAEWPYWKGYSLFLSPPLLLTVRGHFNSLFQIFGKQRVFSFVYAW